MILNKNFFDDIEIKDEDLTTEEPNLILKEYNKKTSRELIEHKMSESEMVLVIHINQFNRECNNIWRRIEHIMKRLKYILDIYNININLSEPFITYSYISFDILKYKFFPNKNDNYTIIQHEGCNLYFPEDRLREYGPDKVIMEEYLDLFVFLDKKIPVFKTARNAYNFVIGLDKCIWKDITDYDDECFEWYDLYNINDIYYGSKVTGSFSDNNSYVTDNARVIFETIIRLVPEELAEQLKKKRNLLQLDNKQLKTEDVKEIIKMTEQ